MPGDDPFAREEPDGLDHALIPSAEEMFDEIGRQVARQEAEPGAAARLAAWDDKIVHDLLTEFQRGDAGPEPEQPAS